MKLLVFSTNDHNVRVSYNTDLITDEQQVLTVLSIQGLKPLQAKESEEDADVIDETKLAATLAKGLHEGTFRIQPTTEQYTVAKFVKFATDNNLNLDVVTTGNTTRLVAQS